MNSSNFFLFIFPSFLMLGMLFGMPDSFMRIKAKECFGVDLPETGKYAVANVFFPPGSDTKSVMADCKAILARLTKERGLKTVGWRPVPVDNSMLGKDPLDSEPITAQIFISNTRGVSQRVFEQDLMLIRKMAEDEATAMLGPESGFYINSLTSTHITYKGQLTPEQVSQYYLDLKDPLFISHLGMVHSRFSTNTFPSWERAQPIRMMCHNGEINTLRGNKNWMYSRGGMMESKFYGDDTTHLLPATSDYMSDSGNFDSVLELLTKASDRSLPEAVMMMIPEAWQDNDSLSENKKAFYEYNSCIMEPWDGPAMVAFTDGRYIGATLDRNGLRPSRYYVTKDDHVMLSSEIGVVPDLPDSEVKIKHRLEPGKMFLVDFETQRIVPDDEIKEQVASLKPYGKWVEKGMIDLAKWAKETETKRTPMNFNTTNRKLNMFGFTSEKLDMLLLPMAVGGKEALGSMGNDAALAVLSEKPRQINDYFKQLFAQVTNPPIDPIREEIVMSLVCPVGPEGNLLEDPTEEHCQRLVVRDPVLTLEEMSTLKNSEYKRADGSSAFRTAVIDITFPVGSGPDGMLAVRNCFVVRSWRSRTSVFNSHFLARFRLSNESAMKRRMRFKEAGMARMVFRESSFPTSLQAQTELRCLPCFLSVPSTNICSRRSSVPRLLFLLRLVIARRFMTLLHFLDSVVMVYARTWHMRPFAR
jgi:glutamate synthase (NADPH/NADH)